MKIEQPHGAYYGSVVAAPVFARSRAKRCCTRACFRVTIAQLIARLPASTRVIGDSAREIASIEIDSRGVTPGALFVALRGEHTDGHAFVQAAVQNGATAVVLDEARALDVPDSVTAIAVADSRRALSVSPQRSTAIRRARSTCSASPGPTGRRRPRS